jgi:hypothetical protein
LKIILAALLGACSGFYLKKIANSTIGPVTTIAYTNRNRRISSSELSFLIKNPGTEAPTVRDSREAKIHVKVTILTFYFPNQFSATLLGVFRMKMLPIAAKSEPKRQKIGSPTCISSLNHTPADTKTAPTINDLCMPYLFSNQLQGTEKRGCAIVNSRALSVTYSAEIWNFSSIMTLMLEKV